MPEFVDQKPVLSTALGSLDFPEDDEITLKFAMLYEGECEGLGATQAAEKFGYTRQHYYVLLRKLREEGAAALASSKRGPKTNYRRREEVVRQVIRHRFLDPDASADVIAQKIRQSGFPISTRSVERAIEAFGIQKKTLQISAQPRTD